MEWIKCSERMPERMVSVLFFDQYNTPDNIFAGWWTGGLWRPNADGVEGDVETIKESYVTHWMPLPEPPAA